MLHVYRAAQGKVELMYFTKKINSDVVLFLQTRRLRSSLNREQELIFVAILLMLNVCDIMFTSFLHSALTNDAMREKQSHRRHQTPPRFHAAPW